MPKLWNTTIETHREAVREAILETTSVLVAEHGLRAVSMSQIAESTGIGRATLYKYFPNVESILVERHKRHVEGHLHGLTRLATADGDPQARLDAVVESFAMIAFHRGELGTELGALLHRREHVAEVQRQLTDLICNLMVEVAETGHLRDDVPAGELATYCVHALAAASSLPTEVAVRRLVKVVLDGLRPRLIGVD